MNICLGEQLSGWLRRGSGGIMAKDIIFKQKGKEFPFVPVRLDRKKLYGWQDRFAVDENGETCELAYIDEYGTTIIPKGGMGLGILSPENRWIDRSELKAVDENGNQVDKVPSTFSAPVALEKTVTVEEFLDHEIYSIYSLQGGENHPDFVKAIASGPIYTFIFNYRESYEGDPAFLLENEGQLFILVGKPISYTFCSLEEIADIEEISEEEAEEEDLDFGMM